jgi:hypothetical protein
MGTHRTLPPYPPTCKNTFSSSHQKSSRLLLRLRLPPQRAGHSTALRQKFQVLWTLLSMLLWYGVCRSLLLVCNQRVVVLPTMATCRQVWVRMCRQ